jgi:hypothetical protein
LSSGGDRIDEGDQRQSKKKETLPNIDVDIRELYEIGDIPYRNRKKE